MYCFCLSVLVYIPFHALVSTLLIKILGGKLTVKGIKDLAILLAVTPLIYLVYKNKSRIELNKIHKLCLAFIAITLLISVAAPNTYGDSVTQVVAGFITIFRYLGFFLLSFLASLFFYRNDSRKSDQAVKLVVAASVVVVAFGFLQVFLLPKDFLSIFGYGAETIKPYQTIDNNESFIRILSTLRGPNPLGAYLAMLAPLVLYWLRKIKFNKYLKAGAYPVFFITTIYGAQSRSAWIGLLVGLITYALLMNKNKKSLIRYLVAILPLIAAGYLLRNTQFVQNTIFHNDPTEGNSINSDDQRISSLTYALRSVNEKPFGHGVGSSGPASNYGSSPVIIENQYLDIAYQIGWLGLACYLGIVICVGWMLIRQGSGLSYALFSGLVAVSIIALFWPVWTDETVALTWWGLAGIVISSGIVHKKKKQ